MTFLDAAQSEISHVTLEGRNPNDRWELVAQHRDDAGRHPLPAISFHGHPGFDCGERCLLGRAFVYVLPNAVAPDLGAHGNTEAEGGQSVPQHLVLRSPDLYRDWDLNRPTDIVWDSYGNASGGAVRIDLYQDGPDGPQLRANIAPATEDDGQFTWIAASSGLDYGTYGLRVQVSSVAQPLVVDRSTETFTVPENTTTFYVTVRQHARRRVRHGSGQ